VPQLHLPIFTGGRLSASLDYAEVRKEIRVAEYERSIQNAFRDVADGLAARGTFGKQLAAQRELVRTTEEYVALAQQRFDEGVASYLTVLDERRNLFMTQQLLSDHLAQLSSEVLLYKALGGGWEAPLRPTELAER
jgi:multidrug efflux system outer membrane protein